MAKTSLSGSDVTANDDTIDSEPIDPDSPSTQWTQRTVTFTAKDQITCLQWSLFRIYNDPTTILFDNITLTGTVLSNQKSCSVVRKHSVINPGFEDSANGSPWTFTNGAFFATGAGNDNSAHYAGINGPARQKESCNGPVAQVLSGLVPGAQYAVNYWYVGGSIFGTPKAQCNLYTTLDGNTVDSGIGSGTEQTSNSGPGTSGQWVNCEFTIQATQTSHKLGFEYGCNLQTISNDGASVDSITVSRLVASCPSS